MELLDSWSLQSLHMEEIRVQPTSNQLEMLGLAPPTTNSSIQLICISVKENASAQQQPHSSRPACLKSVHETAGLCLVFRSAFKSTGSQSISQQVCT